MDTIKRRGHCSFTLSKSEVWTSVWGLLYRSSEYVVSPSPSRQISRYYSAFLLSLHRVWKLSRDVKQIGGFLRAKATALGLTIKEINITGTCQVGDRGSTVVKVMCYKSEGRWFDPSWFHWIFYIKPFRSHYGPGVDAASNINEYQEHFLGG